MNNCGCGHGWLWWMTWWTCTWCERFSLLLLCSCKGWHIGVLLMSRLITAISVLGESCPVRGSVGNASWLHKGAILPEAAMRIEDLFLGRLRERHGWIASIRTFLCPPFVWAVAVFFRCSSIPRRNCIFKSWITLSSRSFVPFRKSEVTACISSRVMKGCVSPSLSPSPALFDSGDKSSPSAITTSPVALWICLCCCLVERLLWPDTVGEQLALFSSLSCKHCSHTVGCW